MTELIKILRAGPALSLQDQGRSSGYAKFGVPPAGCMDNLSSRRALDLLNRPPSEAVIEIGLGGSLLEILKPVWMAHTGGLNCQQLPAGTAKQIPAGTRLEFAPGEGMWSYLAIDGKLTCEPQWGSCSKRLTGLDGDLIHASLSDSFSPAVAGRYFRDSEQNTELSQTVCVIHRGPHFDRFPKTAIAELTRSHWVISDASNRVGYRLDGPKIHSDITINSLPTLPGSLQIPPSGQPIVTLHDGPTTGGYPIIAVITPEHLNRLTQKRPGQLIHFDWYDAPTA